jgi:hypothetical protein
VEFAGLDCAVCTMEQVATPWDMLYCAAVGRGIDVLSLLVAMSPFEQRGNKFFCELGTWVAQIQCCLWKWSP